jgi:hypothetical protein
MPLLDHFRGALADDTAWTSFHATWAVAIADDLNERLPEQFRADPYVRSGAGVEIDVATFEEKGRTSNGEGLRQQGVGGGVATLEPQVWSPPEPALTFPVVFPSDFEIRLTTTVWGGRTLVGAIELISPANKDRPESRSAFTTKCASYLYQGVSLIIIDIVTNRGANLHNELMDFMLKDPRFQMPQEAQLYAAAYRPVLRKEQAEIDVWPAQLTLDQPLPTLPLRLTGDLFVPVDFEAAYRDACQRRRIEMV